MNLSERAKIKQDIIKETGYKFDGMGSIWKW